MKKQMKILFGALGVIAVTGIMAGSVVSCTSTPTSNTSSSSDSKKSTPTAYNNLGSPIKASNGNAWTINSATSYFTKIWNDLTTTQQNAELKVSMDNSILYFEQLFNSTSYNNTSKYPTTIDVKTSNNIDATAKMSYNTTFVINNINIVSPSDVTFSMVLTTYASAMINDTDYKNFFSTTATLTYKDASFISGVAKAGVSINGIMSDDYYAQLVVSNVNSITLNQTPASTSSLSNPTDQLAQVLLSKGWGTINSSYTSSSAPASALPHFIYVGTYDGSTGINFGPIDNNSTSSTSNDIVKMI